MFAVSKTKKTSHGNRKSHPHSDRFSRRRGFRREGRHTSDVPQSPHGFNLPIAIGLLLCLTNIWRKTGKQEENSNE
ncbi:MAG: hypothetical protein ACLUYV_03225 [Alistipes shahii]